MENLLEIKNREGALSDFHHLSQKNYPVLWLLFQQIFGANDAKRRLAIRFLAQHKDVLEIGCSLGVVSQAFRNVTGISYLGIDVDERAIAYANKKFANASHMHFSKIELNALAESGKSFDYILFANILHHVNDAEAVRLLGSAKKLLRDGGAMVVMEPDILHGSDSLLVKLMYHFEQGEHRRSSAHLVKLMHEAGLSADEAFEEGVSMGILPGIIAAHLLVFKIAAKTNQ